MVLLRKMKSIIKYLPFYNYCKWVVIKFKCYRKYENVCIEYKASIKNTSFEGFNWIGERCLLYNVKIGRSSYVSAKTSIANTSIGRYCSIGTNVIIAPGIHPSSFIVSTHPSFYSNPSNLKDNFFIGGDRFITSKPVKIGNDVWIGANAVILDGVEIEDGAIIGANAVVTKNVKAYEIVGGVPAKVIKYRFNTEQINYLKRIKWWDKDIEWIKENIDTFLSVDIFMQKTK